MLTSVITNPYNATLSCTDIPTYGYDWADPLFSHLVENIEYDIFKADLLKICFGIEFEDSETNYVGIKPRHTSRTGSLEAWSAYISNIRGLFTSFTFKSGSIQIPGEHDVIHPNLKGRFLGGNAGSLYIREPDGSGPPVHTAFRFSSLSNYHYPVIEFGIGADTHLVSLSRTWSELTDQILRGDFDVRDIIIGDYRYNTRYTNVSLGHIGEISWYNEHEQFRLSTGTAILVRYGYKLTPIHEFLPFEGEAQEWNPLESILRTGIKLVGYTAAYATIPAGEPRVLPYSPKQYQDTSWTPTWFGFNPIHYGTTGLAKASEFPDVDAFLGFDREIGYVAGRAMGFLAHRDYANKLIPQTFCGMFFSSEDAMDNLWGESKVNVFETLSEIKTAFGLVNAFGLLSAIRRLSSGRSNGLPLIIRLLDMLTDAQLVYSFGLRPTYEDAIASSRTFAKLLAGLAARYGKELTFHGKFDIGVPADWDGGRWPFTGTLIRHRSKIVASIAPDSFLTAVLPLKEIGILPTVSALWETVPFSFVLDWFLGLGNSVEHIENMAIMLAVDIKYGTHSISMKTPWSGTDYRDFGIVADAETLDKGLGYETYLRAVMDTLPIPSPTNLPYFFDGNLPDFRVPSSLAYKLLRR